MLTQLDLFYLLNYDEYSGKLSWAIDRSCNIKQGDVFGGLTTSGDPSSKSVYRRGTIYGKKYRTHRLIWLYVTGEWPSGDIDHINGDSLDNRFSNLRDVPKSENARNQKLHITNKTGICGVFYNPRYSGGKWFARISVDGVENVILRTADFFEACCARKSAELQLGYHFNHGSVR